MPGDPARNGWFGAWSPRGSTAPTLGFDGDADGESVRTAELWIAGARGPQRAAVAVRVMPLARAIPSLIELPANRGVSPSVRFWSDAVRAAVDLVARGRVIPGVSREGFDEWSLEVSDAHDVDRFEALVEAMPPHAHALVADADSARQIGRRRVLGALYDGVADRFTRAPGSTAMSGIDPYAALAPTRVRHLGPWADALRAGRTADGSLVVEIHPPALDEGSDGDAPWTLSFLLRSRRDRSLLVPAGRVWSSDDRREPRFDGAPLDLLVALRRGATICPVLAPALDQAQPAGLTIDDDDIDCLLEAADELTAVGIELRWPDHGGASRVSRRVVVEAPPPTGGEPTVGGLSGLLEIDWEFLVDGLALTVDELQVLARAKRPLVPLGHRWVRLTSADRHLLTGPRPAPSPGDLLALLLDPHGPSPTDETGPWAGVDITVLDSARAMGERIAALVDPPADEPVPDGVHAELRSYQRAGLAWLLELCRLGLGGCLADDMGLGKTLQVLALHAARGGPTLVVCPTSVMANWVAEAARFVPDAQVMRYHGADRALGSPSAGDLVVTTYGVVRSDAALLGAVGWDIVVADEAQHIKNPRSRTAKAMGELGGRSRIALTGTPVENRLSDLWSIMEWAVPGLLGPYEQFRHRLAVPIERDDDPNAAARLRTLLAPFLLRRRKSDPGIAPELPPKIERDHGVALTAEQASLYMAMTDEVMAEIRAAEGISRRGLVLKLLTGLKQIANHPAHFLDETGPLEGRSGKLAALDELIDAARGGGEASLVFTQYVAMARLLVQHLEDRGIPAEVLHGGLAVAARQDLVERFQDGRLGVLVLSLRAGGTGLNLTAATQVVHYDRWWNPAVEDQATDRAYRIGQTAPVTVHRLVSRGTVEERVAHLLADKRLLAERVVGAGPSWIGDLDDQELADLVTLHDGGDGSRGVDDIDAAPAGRASPVMAGRAHP